MSRVVIVQPYVPQYRLPFFERLTDTLAESGVELVVAAGSPEGAQAARGDGVDMPGLSATTRAACWRGWSLGRWCAACEA